MPSRAHYEPAGRPAHIATGSGGGDVADQLAPVLQSAEGGFDVTVVDPVPCQGATISKTLRTGRIAKKGSGVFSGLFTASDSGGGRRDEGPAPGPGVGPSLASIGPSRRSGCGQGSGARPLRPLVSGRHSRGPDSPPAEPPARRSAAPAPGGRQTPAVPAANVPAGRQIQQTKHHPATGVWPSPGHAPLLSGQAPNVKQKRLPTPSPRRDWT